MGKKKAKERKPGGTQGRSVSSQKGKPKDKAKGQTQKEEPTHVDNSPKSEHDRILKEKIEKGEKKKRAQENLKKVKDLPAKERMAFIAQIMKKYECSEDDCIGYISQSLQDLKPGEYDRTRFEQTLAFDIRHIRFAPEPQTLHQQYLTKSGWDRKLLEKEGKSVVPRRQATKEELAEDQLCIYRTMSLAEWEGLKGKPSSLKNHLGDFKEAVEYLYLKSSDVPIKVLVEFPIKRGREANLFSPNLIGFPSKIAYNIKSMSKVLLDVEHSSNFSENEAKDKTGEKVGIKSEDHGDAKFSFSLPSSNNPTKSKKCVENLMSLIDIPQIGVLAYNINGKITFLEEKKIDFVKADVNDSEKATDKTISAESDIPQPEKQTPDATPSKESQPVTQVPPEIPQSEDEISVVSVIASEIRSMLQSADEDEQVYPDVPDLTPEELRRLDMPAASDPERKMIPEAQYVAEKNWIIVDYGGGGDCLFRALSASSDPEVFLKLRQEIVIEEQEAGLVQKGFVDANLMGMLENSLYPELRDLSVEAIHKQNIPIEAYHKLMALQGTWGGDMEILAFTRLGHQIVYVIDENGTMFCYEEGESQRIDEIPDGVWENESIVLYKTRDHWRRVTGRYHTQ